MLPDGDGAISAQETQQQVSAVEHISLAEDALPYPELDVATSELPFPRRFRRRGVLSDELYLALVAALFAVDPVKIGRHALFYPERDVATSEPPFPRCFRRRGALSDELYLAIVAALSVGHFLKLGDFLLSQYTSYGQ